MFPSFTCMVEKNLLHHQFFGLHSLLLFISISLTLLSLFSHMRVEEFLYRSQRNSLAMHFLSRISLNSLLCTMEEIFYHHHKKIYFPASLDVLLITSLEPSPSPFSFLRPVFLPTQFSLTTLPFLSYVVSKVDRGEKK